MAILSLAVYLMATKFGVSAFKSCSDPCYSMGGAGGLQSAENQYKSLAGMSGGSTGIGCLAQQQHCGETPYSSGSMQGVGMMQNGGQGSVMSQPYSNDCSIYMTPSCFGNGGSSQWSGAGIPQAMQSMSEQQCASQQQNGGGSMMGCITPQSSYQQSSAPPSSRQSGFGGDQSCISQQGGSSEHYMGTAQAYQQGCMSQQQNGSGGNIAEHYMMTPPPSYQQACASQQGGSSNGGSMEGSCMTPAQSYHQYTGVPSTQQQLISSAYMPQMYSQPSCVSSQLGGGSGMAQASPECQAAARESQYPTVTLSNVVMPLASQAHFASSTCAMSNPPIQGCLSG